MWKAIDFLLNGVNSEHQRNNPKYRPDNVEATKTSFDYQGKVTGGSKDGDVKIIDNAVTYTTVTNEQRAQAQEELRRNERDGNIATGSGVLGGLFSLHQHLTNQEFSTLSLAGTAAGAGIALLGQIRATQAGEEALNWTDQTSVIGAKRSALKANFNGLMDQNLSGRIFTRDETQDVFHRTVSRLNYDHNKSMNSGDPQVKIASLKQFMSDNPIQGYALDYAFSGAKQINNPKEPGKGAWSPEALRTIALTSQQIHADYMLFQSQNQQEEARLEGNNQVGQALVGVANGFVHDQMDRSANNALSAHTRERNQKRATLEQRKDRGELIGTQYLDEKRRIENEYRNNPDVKAIQENRNQNQKSANLVAFGADVLLEANTSRQRNNFFAERNRALIDKFSGPVAEVLNGYEQARQVTPKS